MPKGKSVFNRTNKNVDWARWTWNPVTGCLHGCPYCYARDIANRFGKALGNEVLDYRLANNIDYQRFPRGPFEPRFWPDRLGAPYNTKIPRSQDIRDRSVFVCSMGDLFGEWVPQEWIDQVMDVVLKASGWNFIFLTKNPERLLTVEWPRNAWVGATADTQERAERALRVFQEMALVTKRPKWTFLSCEPLLEGIDFQAMGLKGYPLFLLIDWIIVGGQSRTSRAPAFQPEWEWVEKILVDGHRENLPVYFKPNLTVRPVEYPG